MAITVCVGCSFKSHLAFPAVQICSFFTAPAKTIFFRPHETWHFLRHLSASVYVIIHLIMDNWWIIIINIVYKSTLRVHCDKILYILIGIMCYRKNIARTKTKYQHRIDVQVWLVVWTPLKNMSWSNGIIVPNWMETHKIPWFQTTNQVSIVNSSTTLW